MTQIEVCTADLAALRASKSSSPASNGSADADFLDGEANRNAELRRLRVELDKKGSEMDIVLKEAEGVRAELKVMKGMFNAAEAGAGAAGADEDSLRKRVSQLMCENGLLKGEKDWYEALAASAASEAKSNSSRATAEIERLEREVEELRARAGRASDAAAEGERAKTALGAMEAKLLELRRERTELQVLCWRAFKILLCSTPVLLAG